MYNQTVGDRIRKQRRSLRMPQAQLSELALIAPSTIALVETGAHYPRPSTLKAIAAALGVTVHELVG